MQILTQWIAQMSDFLWDHILLFLLLGTGIFFTFRLKFIQIRRFGQGVRFLFCGLRKKKHDGSDGGMSSFQALTTAIAAQVGTGNITGCATAIVSGGPGAVFWMWVSAFFGMATIYAEAVLAQKFKVKENGHLSGGPVYYIRAVFQGRFGKILAGFFSVAIIVALGFAGNMVQSNSIGSAFENAFGIPSIIVGIFVAICAAFIFIGGTKRVASFTEKIVPFMACFYIVGCLICIGIHYASVADAFRQIFVAAFQPQAIAGGVVGVTVQKAMRFGVARGLFSNEAGMGSTPHAHALAKVDRPQQQGAVAMVGVFVDTFIILTLTALVILTSGVFGSGADGAVLAQAAFDTSFGAFGSAFIAICMLFFAFSTIIGWHFFGLINVRWLFKGKGTKIYSAVVVLFIALGSCLKVEFVWNISDLFNGLMVIPNCIALLALSGLVAKICKQDRAPASKLEQTLQDDQ